MITKYDFILRGCYFCEKFIKSENYSLPELFDHHEIGIDSIRALETVIKICLKFFSHLLCIICIYYI